MSYSLGANLENLTLTGILNLDATGNALDNILQGNAGRNVLDGREGRDTLIGGAGDDTYLVNGADEDVIVEQPNQGYDSVISHGSYTLSENVEKLTLTGELTLDWQLDANWNWNQRPVYFTATGNARDNVLVGRKDVYVDILDGGAGADTMISGHAEGGGTFYVDNVGDQIVSRGGNAGTHVGNIDNVVSSINWTLASTLENLQLRSGSTALSATGNGLDNELRGNENANTLYALGGNDALYGGAGVDTLVGGLGNDTYYLIGDSVDLGDLQPANPGNDDLVVERAGEGVDTVYSIHSHTLNDHVENLSLLSVYGTNANIDATGNTLANTIYGNEGDNVLDGRGGDDTLYGNLGSDTYRFSGNWGNDTIWDPYGPDQIEVLDFDAAAAILSAAPTSFSFDTAVSIGFAGSASTIEVHYLEHHGGRSIEFADGTTWNATAITARLAANNANTFTDASDAIVGTGGNNVLDALGGDDTLSGGAGNDSLNGGGGEDHLFGNTGNDVLEGGADVDTLAGGGGSDTYVFKRGTSLDFIVEHDDLNAVDTIEVAEGIAPSDLLVSVSGLDLSLMLPPPAGQFQQDEFIVRDFFGGMALGVAPTRSIEQVRFADGTVWDQAKLVELATTQRGTATTDNLPGTRFDDRLYGMEGGDGLTGQAGNDVIDAGSGDDLLGGDEGDDTLIGGSGNDAYHYSPGDGNDVILDSSAGATESNTLTIHKVPVSMIALTTSPTGEVSINVQGSGSIRIGKTGDLAVQYIYSQISDGDPVLINAELGLPGGLIGSGTSDTISGTARNDSLRGLGGNDILSGGAGDDLLDGGAGADSMRGGAGDDYYLVDDLGDAIIEDASQGIDTVESSVTLTLSANVENLILTGSAPITGYGNAADNTLTGNDGANVLKGGAGDDTYMIGAGDRVYEEADAGIDTVISDHTYTLTANAENLTLSGSADIDATGNDGTNTLIGNSGANTLDGGAGADSMVGGLGDDAYVVDTTGDVVTEEADSGIDTVKVGIDYTLGLNTENLSLTGTANTVGRGNALDNLLSGGGGANLLQGLDGNDLLKGSTGNDISQGGTGNDTLSETAGQNLLDGGAGDDTLTGNSGDELYIGGTGNDLISTGSGADMIAFNRGDGQDTVTASTAPDNTLTLGGGIAYGDLAFRKSGNDLVLDTGQGESIALQNWYLRSNYHHVVNLQVVAEAMAGFSPGGSDPLRDNKLEQFNFTGLVDRFDQARAATPTLSNWALNNALLEFHIGGSDTAAIGGDLAYQYGKNNNLSNVSLAPAQAVLGNTNFGSAAQALQPLASLQDSSPRLG